MIQLTNDLIRGAIERPGYGAAAPGLLHLVGIRSCRRVTPQVIERAEPRPNHYDDVIVTFGTHLEVFQGTVDPGRRWELQPLNAGGCAHLADGGPYHYAVGIHHKRPALIQAGPVRLWRDRDRDNHQDLAEITHTESGNGIDIHRMGFGPLVEDWSAGCQGVPLSAWDEFWAVINTAHAGGQRQFLYWLIDGSHLI